MFDTVVIGGGHAGIEASLAAVRRGAATALITMKASRVGEMSCNPAIGGVAKGIVVREIDALGGAMAEAADSSAIQFRMLNRRKGPAVWGPRVQCDSGLYAVRMRDSLAAAGVSIIEGEAISFRWDGGRVRSVILADGGEVPCRSAVLSPGTFLGGMLYRGREKWRGGRAGDPSSDLMAGHLVERGFHVERFKTGTPPRLLTRSLDYDMLKVQSEEGPDWRFSFRKSDCGLRVRAVCHTTKAGRLSVERAVAGLSESPLYSGRISSRGPRYCPSFEDKAVRFPDREGHPVFLEPMGIGSRLSYVNGVSTSLSRKAQLEIIRSIPGCGRAVVAVWGYAVEYGYLPGDQIDSSLRLLESDNLFAAGQICGTSGYEEAGGLGLVAGANAAAVALSLRHFVPERDTSYIGVMVHDIVSSNLAEPYRLFSSRAENRMHLRPDNAARRLLPLSCGIGLSRRGDHEHSARLESGAEAIRDILSGTSSGGKRLKDLCRQPGFDIEVLAGSIPALGGFDAGLVLSVALDERYGGYVEKAFRRSREVERLSGLSLEAISDYGEISEISWEARESLKKRRPASLREAASVPGVRPSDLDGLLIHLLRKVPRGTTA